MCLRCNTSISGINLFLKLAEGVGKLSNGKWRERERGRKRLKETTVSERKFVRRAKEQTKKEQSNKWMKHMMRNEHVSCIMSDVFVCVCSSAAHCFKIRPLINVILPSLSPSLFFLPDLWVSLLLFSPSLSLSLTHSLRVKRPLLICSALGCYGNCPDGQDLEFGSSFTS